MNQAPEIEVVDLGDAKEQTMGLKSGPVVEDNQQYPRREID